jgi:cob(I)alamin adenosyltransferase
MSEPRKTAKEMMEKGLVVVYTGEGKGKTTAALGMVFRALGRHEKVAVVQFIKGKWKTGERDFAQALSSLPEPPGLNFSTMGEGFTWESQDLNIDKAAAQAAWEKAKGQIHSGEYFLLVLDEITYTFHHGFLPLPEVLETLRTRPKNLTVVLTGRNAPPGLLEMADLVTEMKKLKHPFDEGWPAKPGVDF